MKESGQCWTPMGPRPARRGVLRTGTSVSPTCGGSPERQMGSVESQGRGRPRVGPQADWAVTSEERGRHKPWAPVDRGQSGCERSPWEQGTPPSEQDRGGATPVVLGWVSEEGHQEPYGVCHLRVSLTFGGAEPNSCWQGDPLEWARFLCGGASVCRGLGVQAPGAPDHPPAPAQPEDLGGPQR